MAQSRGAVNQRLYLGLESIIGAAVGANKKFPSLSLDFERMQDDQFYRPMGQLVPGSGVKHREMSEPSWEMGLDYNEVIYALSGLFGAPTTTNPTGSVYQHVWTPTESNFGTPATFTARKGDNVASSQVAGFHFNSLDLNLSDDAAECKGDGFGYEINDSAGAISETLTDEVQQIAITGAPTGGTFTLTFSSQTTGAIAHNASAADIQTALEALSSIGAGKVSCYGSGLPDGAITVHFQGTLGATNVAAITATGSLTGGTSPAVTISTLQAGGASYTTIAQQPVSKSEVDVYVDSSAGNIGTTKFCDALEIGLNIPPVRNPVKVLCTYYPSFKDSVQQAIEEMRSRVVMIKNTDVIAFIKTFNARNKPTRYFRYLMQGATITGNHKYMIQIDQALKCETPKDVSNVQETYAYEVNARFVADSGLGGPIKITVKNTLASL